MSRNWRIERRTSGGRVERLWVVMFVEDCRWWLRVGVVCGMWPPAFTCAIWLRSGCNVTYILRDGFARR